MLSESVQGNMEIRHCKPDSRRLAGINKTELNSGCKGSLIRQRKIVEEDNKRE